MKEIGVKLEKKIEVRSKHDAVVLIYDESTADKNKEHITNPFLPLTKKERGALLKDVIQRAMSILQLSDENC